VASTHWLANTLTLFLLITETSTSPSQMSS
jgi:hypothetical protein